MRVFLLLVFFATVFAPNLIFAQDDSSSYKDKKYVEITPNPNYEISGFGEIFLGEHWRKLWTTPIEVEVLNLQTYKGGITPFKPGGGLQTYSLHFKNDKGERYKFRTIDKDPKKLLDPDLWDSFVAETFQDQISMANPYAAVITAPLMDAVGIINARPEVIVLPDDPALGEFREKYKNLFGTLEPNPGDGFAGSDDVVDTDKLYAKLEKDNDKLVNSTEFLKARLFDVFVGDWDRHLEQWKWAGYKQEDGKTLYIPIPRDRDQAFVLYDGLLPSIAERAITQFEGYGEEYNDMYNLTWNGRKVDRRFLPPLEKHVWDSVAAYMQSALTDAVIEDAVRQMPPNWYALEGERLVNMIKSRRDKLREASDEYYELVSSTVDIWGSNKKELVEITPIGDDRVRVTMYKINKEGIPQREKPIFDRTFNNDETGEARIYMLGGADEIFYNGDDDNGITFRIITKGKGDKIRDRNEVASYYKNNFKDSDPVRNKYEPIYEDRGYDWRFAPGFSYNSDDGVILGGGPILYKFGFRVKPYVYRMELVGSYATGTNSFRGYYNGEFYDIIKGATVLFNVLFSQQNINDFYGTGNETVLDDNLNDNGFYQVSQQLVKLNSLVRINTSKYSVLSFGPTFTYSEMTSDSMNTFLDINNPYGKGVFSALGFKTNFKLDNRDNQVAPQKGFYALFSGDYHPEALKNDTQFVKAGYDLRTYLTASPFTLALRTAGEKIWGGFPFFESAFLGGISSLRGFDKNRFAGDASFLNQAELRIGFGRTTFIIPGVFGISLFGETGRVFSDDETSDKWHSSYGGGIWMSYLQRAFNIGVNVANSTEGLKIFVGNAFLF